MNVTSDTHPRPLALNHRPAFSKYVSHPYDMAAANKSGMLPVEEYQRVIATLQRQLKEQQSESLAKNTSIEYEKKRCRVQRKLIEHLRGRLSSAEAEVQEYQWAENARREVAAKGNIRHREQDSRVSSLQGAFLRINGEEAVDSGRPVAVFAHAEFDETEFLPVAEPQESEWLKNYWSTLESAAKQIRTTIISITQRLQVQKTE